MYFRLLQRAQGEIQNHFRYSHKSWHKIQQYLGKHYPVTFKQYSDTKFVGHLSKSFEATRRNINGVLHVLCEDLSATRSIGRTNLFLKNLVQCVEFIFGISFMMDLLTNTIIPISAAAQSDLHPKYLFPKKWDKVKSTLTNYQSEFKQLIDQDDDYSLIPSTLQNTFNLSSDVKITETGISFEPDLKKLQKNVFKYYKKMSKKKHILITRIKKTTLNTTELESTISDSVCGKCNENEFIVKGNGDWIYCDGCRNWFHYGNGLCEFRRYKLNYWKNRRYLCDTNNCHHKYARKKIPELSNDHSFEISDDEGYFLQQNDEKNKSGSGNIEKRNNNKNNANRENVDSNENNMIQDGNESEYSDESSDASVEEVENEQNVDDDDYTNDAYESDSNDNSNNNEKKKEKKLKWKKRLVLTKRVTQSEVVKGLRRKCLNMIEILLKIIEKEIKFDDDFVIFGQVFDWKEHYDTIKNILAKNEKNSQKLQTATNHYTSVWRRDEMSKVINVWNNAYDRFEWEFNASKVSL